MRYGQSDAVQPGFSKIQNNEHSLTVPPEQAGQRLDRVVADWLSDYSRARLQAWITQGAITLDGETVPPRYKLKGGESVRALLPEPADVTSRVESQDIPLQIHYSDDQLFVIEKPAGMVMHTAPGNLSGTMQNALLHHDPKLSGIPRAGIVHRLDKDTSGLVMIARTLESHFSLVQQLQDRTVHRIYDAIVHGEMVAGGTVDEPIGRHPIDRKRMAVNERGKVAITHYRVLNKFPNHCHIGAKLETGRTHQIRVHLSHIHHPLIGDTVYGRRNIPGKVGETLKKLIVEFPRQALHAKELGIVHPKTGEDMHWDMPMPADMQRLLEGLYHG